MSTRDTHSLELFEKEKVKDRKKALKDLAKLAFENLKIRYPSVPEHAIPPPKYADGTANGLTKCVIDFILLNGYQAERINSMGRQVDNTKTSTDVLGRIRTIGSIGWIKGTGKNGTADISATIKGRSVKIEVKCKATKDNYQSAEQKAYQLQIERAGGVYVIARDFRSFRGWYNNFIQSI